MNLSLQIILKINPINVHDDCFCMFNDIRWISSDSQPVLHSRTDSRLITRRWISQLATEAASSLTPPRLPPCRGQAAPGGWGRAGPEARAVHRCWAPAPSLVWTRPPATGILAPTSASASLSARPPGLNRRWVVNRPTPLSSLTGYNETKIRPMTLWLRSGLGWMAFDLIIFSFYSDTRMEYSSSDPAVVKCLTTSCPSPLTARLFMHKSLE